MTLPAFITNVIYRAGARAPGPRAAPEQTAAWQRDMEGLLGVLVRRHREMEACRHDAPANSLNRFDQSALLDVIDETFGELKQFSGGWIDARHEDAAPLLNAAVQKLCFRDREAVEAWFFNFGKEVRTYTVASVSVAEEATGTELQRAQVTANIGKALNLIHREVAETDTRAATPGPNAFVPVKYRVALDDFLKYGVLSEHNNDDAELRQRLAKLVDLAPGGLSVRGDAVDEAYHQTLRDGIARLTDSEVQALQAWFSAPEHNADRLVSLLCKDAPVALRDLRNIQAYVNEMAAPGRAPTKVEREFSARARTISDLESSLIPLAQCFHSAASASVSKEDLGRLIQACYAVERDQKDWTPLLSDARWNEGYQGSHATVLLGLVERVRRLAEHHQWMGGNASQLSGLADELCFHLGCMLPEAEALWKASQGQPASDAAAERLKPYLARMGEAVAIGVAHYRKDAHMHQRRVESQIASLRADLSKGRTADRAKLDRLVSELRRLSSEALISGTDPAEFAGLHAGVAHVLAATAHSLTEAQLTELAQCEGLGLPMDRIVCHARGMRRSLEACAASKDERDLVKSVTRYANHATSLHETLRIKCPAADSLQQTEQDLIERGLKLVTARLGKTQRANLRGLVGGSDVQVAIATLEDIVKDGTVDLSVWKKAKVPGTTIAQVERGLAAAISGWKHALASLGRLVGVPEAGRPGSGVQSAVADRNASHAFVDTHFGIKLGVKASDSHDVAILALRDVELTVSVEGDARRAIISSSRETHTPGSTLLANMMDAGSLAPSDVPFAIQGERGEEAEVPVNRQLMLDLDRLQTSAGPVQLLQGEASANPSRIRDFVQSMWSICREPDKLWFFSGLLNQTSWGLFFQPQHRPVTSCHWITYGSDKFENQDWPLDISPPPDAIPDSSVVRYNASPQRFASSLDRQSTQRGDLIVLKSELKTTLLEVRPSPMADPGQGVGLDPVSSPWHFAIKLKVPADNRFERGEGKEWDLEGAEMIVDRCVMAVEEPYRPLQPGALPEFIVG